jgi:uncharacterized protein YbaR (Trm112 family)
MKFLLRFLYLRAAPLFSAARHALYSPSPLRAIFAGVARPVRAMLESQEIPTKVNFMAIPQDLLEMLVCPVCKAPVKLLDDQSGLKCPICRRVYPVRDDIPVMLPEEASIAAE